VSVNRPPGEKRSWEHNEVWMEGRLGGNPDAKTSRTGTAFIGFSLCNNNRWYRCTAYDKPMDLILRQNLRKGDIIRINGRLESYEAPHTCGQRVRRITIVVERTYLVARSRRNASRDERLAALAGQVL
jgi:single-stranded DNA-binding protein